MTPLSTTPLLAFAVTLTLHLVARRVFPRLGLLDFPNRYGLDRPQLPYPTGIIAVLVFFLFFPFLEPKSMQATGLIIATALLAIACSADDRHPLPPLLRLSIHILVAVIIFVSGTRIYSLTNPLEGLLGMSVLSLDRTTILTPFFGPLPLLSGLFTVIWLGLTINALNWFDGIPGQVTTISTLAFVTIGLLSLSMRVNQPGLAAIAFLLAGIAAGSLLFDFPPPKVVLGDSGAMFFGLMIGVLTIYSGGKVATAFLALGVPLIDLFLVITRRMAKGRSPFRSDRDKNEHLHNRLLAKGWSPRQIILLTASIGLAFGVTALFMDTFQKFVSAVLLFMVMVGLSFYSSPTRH
ncbi:MAG: glycosyl transferase family protein [Candidatus Peregrinibacteria bacterium Greene0416_19]|nr:MAG: glycosyl transferase family protein [Candidatus Peregrinibacteria bacterium Greene0416_19]